MHLKIRMKKYYIRRDDQLKGPFTIAEILKSGLRPTDLVQSEEMNEWKLAVDVDDFKKSFLSAVNPGDKINVIQKYKRLLGNKIIDGDYEKSKYFSLFVWSLVIMLLLVVFYFLKELF